MKNILKYALIFAIGTLVAVSCTKKDHSPKEYNALDGEKLPGYCTFVGYDDDDDINIKVSTQGYVGETLAPQIVLTMYTDAKDWKVVNDYSECLNPNNDWIRAWPNSGTGDGFFAVKFDANTVQGDTRYAKLNIVDKNGRIARSIHVEQDKAAITTMEVSAFLTYLAFDAEASKVKTVPVNANVKWDAYVIDSFENDWVTISEKTDYKFEVSVQPNFSTEARTATIEIFQVSDGTNTVHVTVHQDGVQEPEPEA